MKKQTNLAVVILTLLTFGVQESFAQRSLYPEVKNYYSAVNAASVSAANTKAVLRLKELIEVSEMDVTSHVYRISSTNPDAAAFAQVILHTWLGAGKFNRARVVPCSENTLSESAVQYLKSIGYKVEQKGGFYEVSFSDDVRPLRLTIEKCSEKGKNSSTAFKFQLLPAGTESSDSNAIYYSGTTPEELFKSLAADLYPAVSLAKK